MNDASSSISDQLPLNGDRNSQNINGASTTTVQADGDIIQQKKRLQRDQRVAMLDHLLRNLDIMIYAQLSVVYYMECSLFHFILRALPHWFFFTPKPSVFPPVPAHSPFISIIFGPNILCMLLHLLFAPPAAGEATRGYLHGGLLIDFVGQQSPVGRWKLVILDLLILGLQILVFGVTLERTKIKRIDESMGNTAELAEQERQDHDFEERGMLRPDSSIIDDVPLQDLQSSSARRNINIGDEERDDSLRQENTIETENQHPLDRYYTGEHIIAQLNLVDIVRTQWQISGRNIHPPDASASGVRAAVVAAAARRTLSYRINVGSQRRD